MNSWLARPWPTAPPLEQMLRRLRKDFNVGVIVGNPKAERDVIRLQPVAHFVSHVSARGLSAVHVRDQLDHGEIPDLSVLFVEMVRDYAGSATPDVGQHMRVAVFSVATGDDTAVAFPHRVRTADLVLLNKMDCCRTSLSIRGLFGRMS